MGTLLVDDSYVIIIHFKVQWPKLSISSSGHKMNVFCLRGKQSIIANLLWWLRGIQLLLGQCAVTARDPKVQYFCISCARKNAGTFYLWHFFTILKNQFDIYTVPHYLSSKFIILFFWIKSSSIKKNIFRHILQYLQIFIKVKIL